MKGRKQAGLLKLFTLLTLKGEKVAHQRPGRKLKDSPPKRWGGNDRGFFLFKRDKKKQKSKKAEFPQIYIFNPSLNYYLLTIINCVFKSGVCGT